jgi:proteasome accessory factor A
MDERLFGVETEYAVTALGPRGKPIPRDGVIADLLALARERTTHLLDAGAAGVFLENGSRLYLDCGNHPELSTPECSSPWDVVRYTLAGERILSDLGEALQARGKIPELSIFKCNVDYSGSRTTWGCHESYLHRADPSRVAREIIPHLVSRIVYAGAGGFSNLSPGIEFLLSPRVPHLVKTVSSSSTECRGIFHSKDEPLCGGGFHRMHILSGESLCSERSALLKVGVTALVVRLIEAGVCRGEKVGLRFPRKAMCAYAGDPHCRAAAALADGRQLTAVAIQRHYLEDAEQQLGQSFLPPWAEELCRQWRTVLDRLETDPEELATSLDWPVKLRLMRERARRRGVAWESLPAWNAVAGALYAALARTPARGQPLSAELVLGRRSPVQGEVETLGRALLAEGLGWEGLAPFLRLRSELFEIDTRFGQLGRRGLFGALDREGVFSHRVAGLGSVADAIRAAPGGGRARERGEWIRQLQGHGRRYACTWDRIFDRETGRILDLQDPFGRDVRWLEPTRPPRRDRLEL